MGFSSKLLQHHSFFLFLFSWVSFEDLKRKKEEHTASHRSWVLLSLARMPRIKTVFGGFFLICYWLPHVSILKGVLFFITDDHDHDDDDDDVCMFFLSAFFNRLNCFIGSLFIIPSLVCVLNLCSLFPPCSCIGACCVFLWSVVDLGFLGLLKSNEGVS